MAFGHDREFNRIAVGLTFSSTKTKRTMKTNNETDNLIGPDRVMDVRPIPCSIKHGLIIRNWLELAVGDHFILLNDHDPVPLYYQFAAQWPGAFTWDHLVKGPHEFRVKITKLRAVVDAAQLVSGSCGHH
jgi:uncharacterized protein (DUF2249 family)